MAGEGLGNTFLLAHAESVARAGLAPAEAARRACGERFDGLLVLGRREREEGGLLRAAWIFNRDGSDGGVCLNGLRVAALWERGPEGTFVMAGRRIGWKRHEGAVQLHLRRADLPDELPLRRVPLGGLEGVAVPFWNPHCVVPVPCLEGLDLRALAAAAGAHAGVFPGGVNVEAVAEDGPGRIRMRVWERGVGETRACGSGAVAVALVAWAGGAAGPLEVRMPGGALLLAPDPGGGVLLTGPASIGMPLDLALD